MTKGKAYGVSVRATAILLLSALGFLGRIDIARRCEASGMGQDSDGKSRTTARPGGGPYSRIVSMTMFLRTFLCVALLGAGSARAEEAWPDLSQPAPAIGGGEHDAAVVVGVEGYAFVAPVTGAESNAKLWHQYLTQTRGVPPQNATLLTGVDATREEMLESARQAAKRAGPDGTLWFVFIGHGAPSANGKDGLLVAVDAQQKASSLQTHSVARAELLKVLGQSEAKTISVVLDSCFSGRGQDGSTIAPGLQPLVTLSAAGPIDPRIAMLTAAKGDQFAGPLPGAERPAFSYLVLGGLRGWAGSGGQKRLTAGDLWRYATNALQATLRGRNQTPELLGKESAPLAVSAGEKGPDLARLSEATAGAKASDEMFKVSSLPAVPKTEAPKALGASAADSLDFRRLDVEALKKYNAAVKLDKGDAEPEDKAAGWRKLATDAPQFAARAEKRAAEWDGYAAQRKAAEEAKEKRIAARDADWSKLSELLELDADVVPETSKTRWSRQFVDAYLQSPGLDPASAGALAKFFPAGQLKNSLAKLATQPAPPPASAATRAQAADGSFGNDGVAYALGQWRMFRTGTNHVAFWHGHGDVAVEVIPYASGWWKWRSPAGVEGVVFGYDGHHDPKDGSAPFRSRHWEDAGLKLRAAPAGSSFTVADGTTGSSGS